MHHLPRSTTSLMLQPTCRTTPTPLPVGSSALPGGVITTPQRLWFARARSTCASRSQLSHACVVRLPPHSRQQVPVVFHHSAPRPLAFVHARWKCEYPLSLPAPFVEWSVPAPLRTSPDGCMRQLPWRQPTPFATGNTSEPRASRPF